MKTYKLNPCSKRLNLNEDDSKTSRVIKLLNYCMLDGKKSKTEKIFREVLFLLKLKYKTHPGVLLDLVFKRLYTPIGLETKKFQYTFKVPKLISKSTAFYQSLHPVIMEVKKRKTKKFHEALFDEIEKVIKNDSPALRKIENFRLEIIRNKGNLLKKR